MRRVNAELWAGIAMLIVTLGVSTPALLGQVPLRIPHAAWAGVFTVMIAAVIASLMISSERLARWVFCIAPAAAWAALLTAEGSGLFDIVIVVLAAVSVYHLPWQVTAVLIGCNTVVLAVSAWTQGSATGTIVLVAGLYFLLQAGAALSSMTLLRAIQAGPSPVGFDAPPPQPLTRREVEVLRLMGEGCSNREISEVLHLAEGTVKNHVSTVLLKLGARDRTKAVLRALHEGLLG